MTKDELLKMDIKKLQSHQNLVNVVMKHKIKLKARELRPMMRVKLDIPGEEHNIYILKRVNKSRADIYVEGIHETIYTAPIISIIPEPI